MQGIKTLQAQREHSCEIDQTRTRAVKEDHIELPFSDCQHFVLRGFSLTDSENALEILPVVISAKSRNWRSLCVMVAYVTLTCLDCKALAVIIMYSYIKMF